MRKILKKIDNRIFAIGSMAILLISMLPIWYLAFYARPSGDDYGYSVYTRATWLETHSIWEVIKTAAQSIEMFYNGWNGDWFTTFLFQFMPEVFVTYSYWIVPFIMTGSVIICTFVFVHELFVKTAGMPWADAVIYASIALVVSYQFIPSTAIGMYWYVGATHYMLPYAAGLLGIAYLFKYIRTEKIRYVIWMSLCALFIGGSSYFTSLLWFMVLVVAAVFLWKKSRKQTVLLSVPFLICAIGFVIQCKSPGNAVRGGEEFGFSFSLVIETIAESIKRALLDVLALGSEKIMIGIAMFIVAVIGWGSVKAISDKKRFNFPLPLLFVVFMFGCYSAMYAPEIYSEGFDSIGISLGPATVRHFTMMITMILSILYTEGWIVQRLEKKDISILDKEKYKCFVVIPCFILAAILIIWNRGQLKNSVDMRTYEYISSGQAEDFKDQIASQMDILLDDSIKDAVLVPINPDQGPLMHMPVTADENAFTNRVVRQWYQKDSVVMEELQ